MIWQTRTLATWIAYTIPISDKADQAALVDSAQAIGLTPEQVEARDKRREEFAQDRTKPAEAGPSRGSYEAFMAAFARGGLR